MAEDYFLAVDGIEGESADAKHKGALNVDSFSWGATQAGSRTGGGGGAGKLVMQDFHFTAKVSKASPKLFLACATGQHIKKAVLFVRKAGGEQQDYYTVTLSDCLVASYQQSGPSPDPASDSGLTTVPTDAFSLNFSKIELEYRAQARDGGLDEPVKAGWDLKSNKSV